MKKRKKKKQPKLIETQPCTSLCRWLDRVLEVEGGGEGPKRGAISQLSLYVNVRP